MLWEEKGFLRAGKHRLDIVLFLIAGEKTPKEIQHKLNIHFSQVSRTLQELADKNIVQVLNDKSRKGKLYSLTDLGIKLTKGEIK